MYGNIKEAINSLWFALFLAVFGGVANMIAQTAQGEKFSLGRLVGNGFVSAFAGVIVHLFLEDVTAVSSGAKAALVGLSGWSGVLLLNALSHLPVSIIRRIMGVSAPREERQKREKD